MKSKTKQIAQDTSDDASKVSFEEFDKKYGIQLKHPPTERIPGFPVSETSGFRWLDKDEVKLIEEYLGGKGSKSIRIRLNVALYELRKKIRK
jgi:hypothetical protein